ncbi:MAG TPA: methyltransferase domain-containing protein [Bryobacteraceae bacterium]|jgi:SAM-dependent methyltransferase|nr:methyltransferase domain-containing protein [Bryobacteraceae bacterium]
MKRLFGKIFWTLVRNSRWDGVSRALGRVYLRLRPYAVFAGTPEDQEVRSAICTIDGWFAWSSNPGEFSLRLNGALLDHLPLKRTDATRIFGERHCRGYRAFFDVSELSPVNGVVEVQLVEGEKVLATEPLRVSAEAIRDAEAARSRRAAKREWILDHVTCPAKQGDGSVLDFLPEELKQQFRIDDPAAISAHRYDEVAAGIIEEVRKAGGKVLDCGSGLRANIDETVICVEVAALPTVDVLAVNQRLPFQDSAFDAVLSLNVLEHVTDPFTCAAELVRVLKPGGTLYCCIPFLQPEHGYPHHYFNATRAGLRQLFAQQMEPVRTFVPRSGEPIWSLSWFLSSYAAELPERERQRFLNMRLRDIVNAPAQSLLDKNWVERLSEMGKWELASTTAAVFRKAH